MASRELVKDCPRSAFNNVRGERDNHRAVDNQGTESPFVALDWIWRLSGLHRDKKSPRKSRVPGGQRTPFLFRERLGVDEIPKQPTASLPSFYSVVRRDTRECSDADSSTWSLRFVSLLWNAITPKSVVRLPCREAGEYVIHFRWSIAFARFIQVFECEFQIDTCNANTACTLQER